MSARPIRICRVIARMNVGGPAVHITQLASGLPSERFTQLLVAGTEGPGEASMLPMARARGIDPVILPELGREVDARGDIVSLLKLYRLFRSWRPDIVETHTAKAGTLGRLAAALAGVPTRVHVFHGHVLRGYFGPAKTRAFVEIERALARVSTRIITLGETQRQEILGFGIGRSDTVFSIPLGFELTPFMAGADGAALRAEIGTSPTDTVLGIVGRLTAIKRLDIFLKAARLLMDQAPDVRFVVVGDGELRAQLQEQARSLGLAERVHFLGWRSHQQLPELYAGLDVVVNVSDNEGMPVSLIEAMASNVPVVATAVGGTRDVVDDGRTGMLVPPGDAAAVAAACLRLIREPGLRLRLKEAAQSSVYPRFDVSTLLRTMDAFYTSLSGWQPAAASGVM
jgi:glycosyltransferase involved in cell wall biosynthesis